MPNMGLQLPCRFLGATISIGAICSVHSTASAQWAVINLHPADPGVFDSYLIGIRDGQQVGYIRTAGTFISHASVWNGSATSWVDLHPPGSTLSIANSVSNGQQFGYARINGNPRASLWSGTVASWQDLTPPGSVSAFGSGISGNQQVGTSSVGVTAHAGHWTGTAGSWMDLNPPTATSSNAADTDGTQQVGYVYTNSSGGNTRASVWTGTAGSWVNLHPNAAHGSRVTAVHGGQQVGWGIYPIIMRAHLWTGTANSLVNLHPASAVQSRCEGVHAGQQVGMVSVIVGTAALEHAALWSGTAGSWVDLHTFLPPEFLLSEAFDIWHSGESTYVVGNGYNTATQRYEALMWVSPPPAACDADVNNDKIIDVDDLLAIINAWGDGAKNIADINGSGLVDVDDLLMVINSWGPCD